MTADTAIVELLSAKPEWRRFFRSCCESGALRLRAQAWQFREELQDCGQRFALTDVEDSLLTIARKVLPKAPAAEWDPQWTHELCKDSLARLAERYAGLSLEEKDALDLSTQDVWDERMCLAAQSNNPAAFRAALKGWEQAGLEAIERARAKGGAA